MHYWKNKLVQDMSESELRSNLTEAIETIDKLHNAIFEAERARATKPINRPRKSASGKEQAFFYNT